MGRKITVVIEHLEEEMSPWLLLEYRHASIIIGKDNIVYTNIPRKYHKILRKYGRVYEKSVLSLYPHEKIIILDPQAEKPLSAKDLERCEVIVIGGILGDHPPRGRTKILLSIKAPKALKRNIGEGQYSIDGAVYVVKKFIETGDLSSIRYVDGIILEHKEDNVVKTIKLPFRYPLVNNEPLLAPGLRELLLKGKIPDNIWRELTNDIIEY